MGEEDIIDGVNVTEQREYLEQVRRDPSEGERNPRIVARWVGGSRARVEKDGVVLHIGGDEDPSSMWILLASLAACDVDVVATHASLLDLKLESLEVEATGHFDIRRYLGLDGPSPGHDRLANTVRIRAPGATPGQTERLRTLCERGSPVGDSLARPVPLKLDVEAR